MIISMKILLIKAPLSTIFGINGIGKQNIHIFAPGTARKIQLVMGQVSFDLESTYRVINELNKVVEGNQIRNENWKFITISTRTSWRSF